MSVPIPTTGKYKWDTPFRGQGITSIPAQEWQSQLYTIFEDIDTDLQAIDDVSGLGLASATDTTHGYLGDKFVGTGGITVTVIGVPGNGQIEIGAPGGLTDENVKVSAVDTTAGYLTDKLLEGAGIVFTASGAGDETLTIAAPNAGETFKVSAADNFTAYLSDKLVAGDGIVLTILNPGTAETFEISAPGSTTDIHVKTALADTTADYLEGKVVAGAGISLATVDQGGGNLAVEVSTVTDYMPLSGGTMTGDLNMGGNDITNATTLNTHTIPGGTDVIALLSDIPAAAGLDGVLGVDENAYQKDLVVHDNASPGGNIAFKVDYAGKQVIIGSGSQNYDLELYGDFNMHSAITGVTTINTHTVPGGTGTFALVGDLGDYLPLAGGTMLGSIDINGNALVDTTGFLSYDPAGFGGVGSWIISNGQTIYRVSHPSANIIAATIGGKKTAGMWIGDIGATGHFASLIGIEEVAEKKAVLSLGGLSAFSGEIEIFDSTGTKSGTVVTAVLGADRTYTLPDADGTVALESAVSGVYPIYNDGTPGNLTSITITNGIITGVTVA